MTYHKFKRLTRQLNIKPTTLSYQAAEKVLLTNMTITEACKLFGVSQQLVHTTVRAIKTTPVEFTDVEKALMGGSYEKVHELLNDLKGETK